MDEDKLEDMKSEREREDCGRQDNSLGLKRAAYISLTDLHLKWLESYPYQNLIREIQ